MKSFAKKILKPLIKPWFDYLQLPSDLKLAVKIDRRGLPATDPGMNEVLEKCKSASMILKRVCN